MAHSCDAYSDIPSDLHERSIYVRILHIRGLEFRRCLEGHVLARRADHQRALVYSLSGRTEASWIAHGQNNAWPNSAMNEIEIVSIHGKQIQNETNMKKGEENTCQILQGPIKEVVAPREMESKSA
jgi:hypothetical protein